MKKQFVFVITLCMMFTILLTSSFAMAEEPVPYEMVKGKIISVSESSIEVQVTKDETYVVPIGYFKNNDGFADLDIKVGKRVTLEGFKAAGAKGTVIYNGSDNSGVVFNLRPLNGTVDINSLNAGIVVNAKDIGMVDISEGTVVFPDSSTITYMEEAIPVSSLTFNLGDKIDENITMVNELQNGELFYASSITVKGKTVTADVYYDEETSSIIVNRK